MRVCAWLHVSRRLLDPGWTRDMVVVEVSRGPSAKATSSADPPGPQPEATRSAGAPVAPDPLQVPASLPASLSPSATKGLVIECRGPGSEEWRVVAWDEALQCYVVPVEVEGWGPQGPGSTGSPSNNDEGPTATPGAPAATGPRPGTHCGDTPSSAPQAPGASTANGAVAGDGDACGRCTTVAPGEVEVEFRARLQPEE
jgi:hypothetical protein